MALNLQTIVNNGLLDEIAKTLNSSVDANLALVAIDFPTYLKPNFDRCSTSMEFWLTVCERIENGTVIGGFEPLLKSAAKRFPGNKVLAPFAKIDKTYVDVVSDTYDVFISYCSKDYDIVKEFAYKLRDNNLKVWFDEWSLPLGKPVSREIETVLSTAKYVLVFFGKNGYGPWQHLEVDIAVDRSARAECNLIPVLLDGVSVNDLSPILKRLKGVNVMNVDGIDDAVDKIAGSIS